MDVETAALVRSTFRQVFEAAKEPILLADLEDLGWDEVLDDDSRVAVGVLFEEQARAAARSVALDAVVLRALGADVDGTVLVHPAADGGGWPTSTICDDRTVAVEGLALVPVEPGARLAVPARSSDGVVLAYAVAATPSVAVGGLAPELGLARVSANTLDVNDVIHNVDWAAARAAAQVALSHELVTLAETMLRVATEHVTSRTQFGRTLASYQAVKHRLADVRVAIEAATSAIDEAWLSNGDPFVAMVAKALSGRAAESAVKHCQQVCGGMGFTTEFPLHGPLRRALVVDTLYGSASSLQREIGSQLLASGAVPRLGTFSDHN